MRTNHTILLALCLALALAGCTTVKGDPYVPGEIHAQGVQMGTITHVGPSSVAQEPTLAGPIIGGGAGALAGGMIGSGGGAPGIAAGAVIGGGMGALAGGYGEAQMRRVDYGLALTVELDNGKTVIIAQPEDDIYTVGDRVRVMRDGKGYGRVQLQ